MAVQSHSSTSRVPDLPAALEYDPRSHDQWLLPEGLSITTIRRLVVLVPHSHIDEPTLIAKTKKIALLHKAQVLFLGLNVDRATRDAIHRRLGLMASKMRSSVVSYTQVLPDTDWIDAIQKMIRPGDVVVMPEEMASPLASKLMILRLPAHLIAGLYPSLKTLVIQGLARLLYEVTPLLIIGGFLWLQIEVANQTTGLLTGILTGLSLIFELGFIYLWSLFLS